MRKKRPFDLPPADRADQPFLYEIRVKGRLDSDQWTSWFDDLSVTSRGGESLLRGRLADRSALYGLLARLRDLAVPLVSVRVLDAEAQLKLQRKGRRYDLLLNLLLVLVYLIMVGGLTAMTVFVAPIIHEALAISILFALIAALAHGFWIWSEQRAWRWIGYVMWPASVLTFLIFTAVADLVHPTLAIAMILFLAAGGIVYLITHLKGRAQEIQGSLVGREAVDESATTPPAEPE